MTTRLQYNGYAFNDLTNIFINADMVYDDSERTVKYHRYKLRAVTTIYSEAGDTYCGEHFRRLRQRLSKAGQSLSLNHAAFGPPLLINVSEVVRDVEFGPKPRVLSWNPVGDTNAVEVVWECEFCLPTCDGDGNVRYSGIAGFNYGITYSIDTFGYTTRVVAGYLEIAMTRINGTEIPDTADAYRENIFVPHLVNFEREHNYSLSADKRKLEFSIIDREIRSPNAYPAGVVKIRASHRVGWTRRSLATLPNTISATIELDKHQPRSRAWEIFRAIVTDRTQYATGSKKIFFEGIEVDEDIYGNSISFSVAYRIYINDERGALLHLFSSTGLFERPPGDWAEWSASRLTAQSIRGNAELRHNKAEDIIFDLCTTLVAPQENYPYNAFPQPPSSYLRLCNPRPAPNESWLRFDASITSIEEVPTVEQITIGKDDLKGKDFDPTDPTAFNGITDEEEDIIRFIESAPAGLKFQWIGYAERVGWDIPKPDRLTFGGVTLTRIGTGLFRKKLIAVHMCQPLYGASWNMTYVVDERPETIPLDETIDPIHLPVAEDAG